MPDWWQEWSDEHCIIVAAGKSATLEPLFAFKGAAKFIVVNNSWKLCPWADILYAADLNWWNTYDPRHAFKGLRVSSSKRAKNTLFLPTERGRRGIDFTPQPVIGWANNSGFHALNLAVKFGCRKIHLVGFDMCGEHWHRDHAEPCSNPSNDLMVKWTEQFELAAVQLRNRGIAVTNCSPISRIEGFPRKDLLDAFLA